MRRAAVLLAAMAAMLLLGLASLQAQAQSTGITVFDKNGSAITRFVDGDSLQLRIKLSQAAQPTHVSFMLDSNSTPVAECTVQTNGDSCDTERFTALGWYWDKDGQPRRERALNAIVNGTMVATVKVQVSPRPVVMAHGFISSADTWAAYLGSNGFLAPIGLRGFAVGDGQVEGKFNTGSIADPAGETNTIAQNAAILGRYIANVRKVTGAQQVDLVGHSMGGLIARYYLDRLMQERDVAQLIMLGTPHNGSDCANLAAALNLYLPASLEIRPSYARAIFNSQITRRRGVQFYELAGTSIVETFKSPCTDVPTDVAVSLESAQGIPLQLTTLPLLHTDLTLSRQVFDSFVKPLLQKPASEFHSEPDPVPAPSQQQELEFTRVFTGHVDAGSSQEVTINIDQVAAASFALYDTTRSLTVTVRGASGNVIVMDPARNGLIVIDDPSTLVYLGYGFQNPRPGPWRITLQATSKTPASGADYAVTAQLRGGATLKANTSKLLPQINEAMSLTAHLELPGQPLPVREAQALIRYPDGKSETLTLAASGAELSANWKPTTSGVHGINVRVIGSAPDGTPVEREAFLSVEVQLAASQVTAGQRKLGMGIAAAAIVIVLLIVASVLLKRRRRQAPD